MSVEIRTKERFAKRLARFVDRERAKLGCAKKAMAAVAKSIGMSAVNVYRAMNGYGPVTIKAHHHVALLMASLGGSKIAGRFQRANRFSHTENVAGA